MPVCFCVACATLFDGDNVAELVTEELRRVAAKARRRTRAGDEDEL